MSTVLMLVLSRFQAAPTLIKPVALLVGLEARRVEEARRRDHRLAQLRRLVLSAGLLGGADQQCRRAGGLRRGHRRAVEHRVAGRQRVGAGTGPPACHSGVVEIAAPGATICGLKPPSSRGPREREGVQVVVVRRSPSRSCAARWRRVMYAPTLTTLRRHRRVADGVDAGAAVAGRDEHLNVVLLDQAVVQHGAGVVAVVERRQAADRHVDHVDVGLLGGVDHALDQRVRGAAGDEQADAHRHDLGARRRAAHRAAEQALPATMPATCEPCAPETMPMLTNLFLPSVCTTNGMRSATAVAGLSVPK